ncbi:LysR family transcriptional regulator [Streptacidiphilus sp. P02-A3a]|uniref:LysR family transcriptional regulator n=1 Tax=Streptacidiphilus sp. P02-A3a TaxID=2704468 RepID=UPI0015FBFC59|nr:LysR family transcriptional regulator [Streptacidiphilus sp. P02-A3a]QMU69577.1 LysR family transcriptional regulator [Streptacidiphilus sp. P02-A3a]
MDPHLLRTFVAVARHGSFSEAARELGYTQSAVSQHIAALEADLGAVLLLRRPVGPTPVGVRLLEHAGPLLLRLDAARADIARLTGAPTTRLTVGLTPLALTARLARALADLRRRHPGLEPTVRVLGREAVPREVATGGVDLGLVDGMTAPNDPLHLGDVGPLSATAVAEQPLAVLLPDPHPLAGRPGLRLSDLSDARWIDAPDTAIPLRQLRAAGGADGYRPSLRYQGTDLRGLAALVAAGHGLALLPRPLADTLADVSPVPLSVPRLTHRTEALHTPTANPLPALLTAALTD